MQMLINLDLKENVVVGRLIPAGTGLTYHRKREEGKRLIRIYAF